MTQMVWNGALVFVALACTVQGSVKKGVVHWADSYECDDFKVLDNINWWYDFRMNLNYFHKNDICTSSVDTYLYNYVPMVWGHWRDTVINLPEDSQQFVLGFNEPNHKKQSNMSPEKAAAAWKEVEKNSKGRKLVSPSAATCGDKCNVDEFEWFDKFFELCKGCRVDYLAAHTYWCNPGKVMRYLWQLYKRYNRKIWLTEFACGKTTYEMEQLDFMEQILPALEDADFVFRYSWYSARIKKSGFVTTSASLLKPDRSELTTLGRFYNDFQGSSSELPTSPKPQITTAVDINVVGRDETLLILKSFTSNPTKWWKVLNFMKKNSYTLPVAVQDVYKTSSNRDLKQRIKKRFIEVLCTDVEELQDPDVRFLVEKIKDMPEGEKKRRRNAGELRVPKC
ncbi:uncharacterized protein LOC132758240 [Ruditapes philippinarum]|uniref:uncharacterized protein LOC132758240 n=1 Tax=Ruditapes philippinarum TaxID=129788 RepID=UPI00295BD496|nr:uncharacterized protein LOC132758240 [Ruditapes philippinarum]